MKRLTKLLTATCAVVLAVPCWGFNCGVSTTPLSFNYDPFSPTATYTTGTVAIDCSNPDRKPMQVTVAISSGASGSFNPRQMAATNGADRLDYFLFTDQTRTVLWGDGTGGTSMVTDTVTRSTSVTYTIYGGIPPRQNVRSGAYTDSLVVTVYW